MSETPPSEFDAFAEEYDTALRCGIAVSGETKEFFARARVDWVRRSLERHAFQPSIILDYGCGTGSATPFFRELFRPSHVFGVDVSARSLDIARRLHGSNDTSFLLFNEYLPKAESDLSFCNGVFHHVPLNQRRDAMRYLFQATRPGGFFAMWENNPWSPAARLVMRRIPFDRDAIMLWPSQSRRLMESAGFQVVATNFLFIFPNALSFLRTTEPFLSRLPLGAQYLVLGRRPEAELTACAAREC